ncbi:MAG: site-2 protease family protein [Acidobacteriaceae bacterium]
MFRHTIPIGRILGIPIDVDYSWFLIFGLVTWLLAVGYYPAELKGAPRAEFWLMGAATALLFFVSIVLHELAHSAVAIHYKIPVRRITLFIFGGVSQIAEDPTRPSTEFFVAIVGPLASFALAAIFFLIQPLLTHVAPALAVAKYLAYINLVLGLFNLIPGFPLDGGRVFRAIVWGWIGDVRRATLIAANVGRFFGFLFILVGVWIALKGQLFNGLWTAFIGWFLESAAASQVQQQLLNNLLAGHKVSEAIGNDCLRVPAGAPLQDIIDQQVLRHGRRCFLVQQHDEVLGMLTLHSIKIIPETAWPTTTAGEAMIPINKLSTTSPDAELSTALEKMGRDGINQMPVMQGSDFVGMLSRDDVVHYLQLLQQLHTR